jgi:hypothetical protein
MPRKPNIKWRESDTQKLEQKIEKFNEKVYRARSRHPELKDILPETVKKGDEKQLIEQFKSMPRSELNKYLNSLERFTRKGAEKPIVSATGNKVTAWEKNEVSLKVAQINRERAVERKKVEAMEATTRAKK